MKKLTVLGALFLSAAAVFGQSAAGGHDPVTAVAGESWLHHLHRSLDATSMGKTWRLGPASPATDERADFFRVSAPADSTTARPGKQIHTLYGSDLYRLNCQGCHGESGLGAQPEIQSLVDPVRATSAALVEQRMKKVGMQLSRRETAEMVKQSSDALLKRLQDGGQDMPSFQHLREAEIRSLVAYLRLLAGVPGAEKEQAAIPESDARIGELVVKSTCHICHGATGLNPTPLELLKGAIPPLSAFPERVDRKQLVRKVTNGAPVVMGATSLLCRGRMPVFSYLSADEAADVYDYLVRCPPTELVNTVEAAYAPQRDSTPTPHVERAPVPILRELGVGAWSIAAGVFTAALLALGFSITWHEVRRLSAQSRVRATSRASRVDPARWSSVPPTVEVIAASPSQRGEAVEVNPADWMERKIS